MKLLPEDKTVLIWLVIALAFTGVIFVQHKQNAWLIENVVSMENEINFLRDDQDKTAGSLRETLSLLEENLTITKSEQAKLSGALSVEQQRVSQQQEKLDDISGTVGTLEKLTYTDEELLQKYSKVYFLNEHYIPTNLSKIPENYVHESRQELQIHTSVLPFLQKLLTSNTDKDFDLKVISAYRSFGTQANLKSAYNVIFGAGTANQFSSDQGYSEHQLGTTVDFTTIRTGTNYSEFEETYDYGWLLENAHKFGFTLSYPENNEFYDFEPWHWRFVGVNLATKLHNEGKHFYDLEQRQIDEFLVSIFD
jgi:zinc D-Ala-D-Ala carboxypeptidase